MAGYFTHFSLTLYQTVRVGDWRRHQYVGLICRVAKTSGPGRPRAFVPAGLRGQRPVDIRRLFANCAQYRARVGVKAHVGMHSHFLRTVLRVNLFDIDPGAGGDSRQPKPCRLTCRFPQATRAFDPVADKASNTASEIWSAILSGCPSDTDSDVKR